MRESPAGTSRNSIRHPACARKFCSSYQIFILNLSPDNRDLFEYQSILAKEFRG